MPTIQERDGQLTAQVAQNNRKAELLSILLTPSSEGERPLFPTGFSPKGRTETSIEGYNKEAIEPAATVVYERPTEKNNTIIGERSKYEALDAANIPFTPERAKIIDSLKSREWFRNTSPELQIRLARLPQEGNANHDGFLSDLAKRPEEIGGIKVERLADLAAGNFALIPKFDVRNLKDDKPYTYEYVSWRYGPQSGAKGIVFVKDEKDDFSHFIVLRGDKFATGQREWDSVGGFADLNTDGVNTMLGRFKKELEEELGAPDIQVSNVHDLGPVLPDAGMTNNKPNLFAAVIDGSEAKKIGKGENPDTYELTANVIIFPMTKLGEVTRTNNDGYFLSAVARSSALRLIDWSKVDIEPIPYLKKRDVNHDREPSSAAADFQTSQ